MPALNTAALKPWSEIDSLLARNRKLSIKELSTEQLGSMIDEMHCEVLAVLAVRDEARGRLVESRRRRR